MKTVMMPLLILATAVLLTGCGHYGMGRHYNNNRYNQKAPRTGSMHGNSVEIQRPYMNGNSMRSQEAYGR